MTSEKNIAAARTWLSDRVFPLWTEKGIDAASGAFVEALSLAGEPLDLPRRAMVQARQIYSFRTGMKLGCCPEAAARPAVGRASRVLAVDYSLPSGAFMHSIGPDGKQKNEKPDLYTQAFALFGMANGFAVSPDERLKARALILVDYLRRERRAPGGGYTELENGAVVLRSNPHMHLFEAALAWMQADPDPRWKDLAEEVLELCLTKFIDSESGALCEYFEDGWKPVRIDGRFLFEPGHHYEWSWLMMLHEELTGRNLSRARTGLFRLAEKHGLSPERLAFDEVWSDGNPKKRSSRFWPQGERVKAAVRLGSCAPQNERAGYARAADDALEALQRFLQTPTPGLWRDTLLDDGQFREEPAKASSLYHIINALDEYITFRPGLPSGVV
jgi:mannose-6-phosphate isomerase